MSRMTATDCFRRLAMVMAISITMVQMSMDKSQPENSKSMMCTMVEDLDVDSAQAMVDVRAGIAELAPNNFCMVPGGMNRISKGCSTVSRSVAFEPNDFEMPCHGWSPGWMDLTAGWKDAQDLRPTAFECVLHSNFHRNSGKFNHVARGEFFIQCNSGNFDTSNFYYHSGIFNYFQFQCNSGKFDLASDGTAGCAMATWPMQSRQVQDSAGDNVCRDSDFQHGFAVGFHGMLGTMVATDRCQNVDIFNDIDYTVDNFSSAGDDMWMFGSTAVDSFFTLVMTVLTMAHDGLQALAGCTGMQPLIVAISAMILVCCGWYCHLQMSHLSYQGDLRTRTCRKFQRRVAIRKQRQLLAMLFLCGFANARAMDEQTNVQSAFLQGMTAMAEAATRAATAAERALERTTGANGGSGSTDGLSAASRILKSLDVYSGDDPMLFQQWKQQFTSWLCFGDSRYVEALEALEKKPEAPPLTAYNADEKDMSQKLFAVLTSYLRGRCAHLVRSEAKHKDGFKLWHTLCREYMPNTRQRALALAQALSAYPVFGKEKSSLESILAFEQLVMQYEEASGSTYPLELMSATLIRCCQPKLREQLQLSINEESTYQEIRDKVLSFERVSKIWSTDQVLKHVQETPSYTGGAADGPTPMEVDRIEKGGKGKQKGKNKGRGFSGSEWLSSWAYGRGRGRGRQNKGKGKGKSKGKAKGKKGGGNKGKGKKGGRGKVVYGQCSNCYEFGHWAKDCPHMVNQVKQEPVPPNSTSSSSNQAAPKASSSPVVRRIFQFGSSPSSPTSPTSPASSQLRMVVFQEMDDSQWMQVSNVCTDSEESEWIILDSGSDVSLLPSRFQPNSDLGLAAGALHNCQGGALQTAGIRKAELVTTTSDGEEVLLQHEFIVGNVTSCLVSLGQLYQGGWTIHKDQNSGDLSLMSPGDEIRIPIEYRNRSFAIKAHVRQVVEEAPSTSVVGGDADDLQVRTVVLAPDGVDEAPMESWEMLPDGTPFFKSITTNYLDPRGMWGKYWPYRTTLIRKHQGEDKHWTVVEVSSKFMDRRSPFGMIDQFLLTIGFDADCETLTLIGVEPHTLLDLGLVAVNEAGDVMFGHDDETIGGLREELPAEQPRKPVPEVLPPRPEDIPVPAQDVEAGDAIEAVPEILVDGPADSVTIHDDLVVTPTSPIKLLRDACKWLGISQAGSKVRMFNRIQCAREWAIKRSVVEAAKDQYRQQYPEVHSIPLPPQPSEKDKAEHMLTHTPFQPWCEFCVKSRSRANQHPHVSDPTHDAQREYPTVQCDFFFMEPGKEDAVIALLMVDVWSRYVSVMPLKPRNMQTVGNALVKFLNDVGHVGKMELAGDNEPVLAAGMRFCQRTRQTLGMETILTWNRTYEKTRTSIAERFVQTVRGLQKTLLSHLESAIQATIPAGHPVIQWAAMHASWLYNRYHVHSSLRTTPFQSLFGRPYRGKIVAFGQNVFGLDPKADKYRPAWIRGAWLGKDSSDMDLISTDGQSVVRTKAIRRIGDEWDATLVLGMGCDAQSSVWTSADQKEADNCSSWSSSPSEGG